MKILAFDTSLNKTYVTLSEDEKILSSKTIENKNEKYHSAFLVSTIVEVLKEHRLQIKDIDAFGVNVGPGSFTGIRACITVARVFAQQVEKPLIGVCSLEILSKLNKSDKNTIVLLDARRGQVYYGMYKDRKEISAPKLIKIEEIDSLPLDGSVVICDSSIISNFKGLLSAECIDYTSLNEDLGVYLSEIVNSKIKSDEDYFWANTKPLYLQTPPVHYK